MKLVYDLATGAHISTGTIVAYPLPAGLATVELTQAQYDGLRNGTLAWDSTTRTIVAATLDQVAATTKTIADKLQAAINANTTALGNVATAKTNVQTNVVNANAGNVAACNTQLDVLGNVVIQLIDRVDAALRQLTGIEKTMLGGDNLLDANGT